MSVTNATIKAVGAVLDLDAGATPSLKQAVTRCLTEVQPKYCMEAEAASLIYISKGTLYKWRNGQWEGAPHDFIFHTSYTVTDEVQYDRNELLAYDALRRIMSTKDNHQPQITAAMLSNYVKFMNNEMA